jgi:hypothetical protein
MKEITDEYMREMLGKAKGYTFLLLRPGPRRHEPGADKVIWEHARRNFALRAEGLLPIVCPSAARTSRESASSRRASKRPID